MMIIYSLNHQEIDIPTDNIQLQIGQTSSTGASKKVGFPGASRVSVKYMDNYRNGPFAET